MHHWFGDLVTCESWANLTLNEGFANYSEYLWAEHHDGAEAADFHRVNELRGYLGSARQQGTHPLIHFGYDDKEEIFRSRDKCYRCKDIIYNILPPNIVVKGLGVSCAGGIGGDCVFWMEY